MASPERLKEIWFKQEGTFGDESAATFPDDYTYIRAVDVEWNPTEEQIEHDYTKIRYHEDARKAGTKSESTLSFKVYLHGWSSSTPAGAPGVDLPFGPLFEGCGMVKSVGGYTTEDVGQSSTTQLLYMTSGAGSGFEDGDPCLLAATGSSTNEVSFVNVMDTNAAYVSPLFSDTPTDGTAIYGGICYSATGVTLSGKSLRFVGLAYDSEANFEFYGCRGSVKGGFTAKGLPFAEFEFKVRSWANVTHTNLGSYNPEPAVYGSNSFPDCEAVMGSANVFLLSDSASWGGAKSSPGNLTGASRTELQVADVQWDLAIEHGPINDIASAQGVSDWFVTDRKSTISVDPIWDADRVTDLLNKTQKSLMVQVGSAPGKIIVIYMPACRMTEVPQAGDREGILTAQCTFIEDLVHDGTYYLEGADGDDPMWPEQAPQNSPFKIAFL